MSYAQAFKIAWSLLWRHSIGVLALAIGALLLHEFLTHQLELHWTFLKLALLLSAGAVYFLAILPVTLRKLTGIRYSDFRVVLRRTHDGPDSLTYREALLLSLAAEVLTGLTAGLALWLCYISVRTASTILGGFLPVSLPALLLAMPLKAAILFWIPTPRFRLEIRNDFESDTTHQVASVN